MRKAVLLLLVTATAGCLGMSCLECPNGAPCARSELTAIFRQHSTVCFIVESGVQVTAAGGTTSMGRCAALSLSCCGEDNCNTAHYTTPELVGIVLGSVLLVAIIATLAGLVIAGKIPACCRRAEVASSNGGGP